MVFVTRYRLPGLLLTVPLHTTLAQPASQNYTVLTTLQQPYIDPAVLPSLGPEQRQQQVTYQDGLGRTIQRVQVQASPTQQDLITLITYDVLGRTPVSYLPYVGGNAGAYQATPLPAQAGVYQIMGDRIANDASPWAVTEFEASPLQHIVRQGASISAWQPGVGPAATSTDHTVKYVYRTNVAREVRRWERGTTARAVFSPTYYAPGQLAVTEVRDEQGRVTVEYQGKVGHVVLRKTQLANAITSAQDTTGFLRAQYVYDAWDHLRLVIQPEGNRHLPVAGGTGKLHREVWNGVPGEKVTDLPLVSGANAQQHAELAAAGNWHHHCYTVTLPANATLAISAPSTSLFIMVDEVRLHPVGAAIFTHDPLVGVTSRADATAQPTFYEYDGFQRLLRVKDWLGNILTQQEYH